VVKRNEGGSPLRPAQRSAANGHSPNTLTAGPETSRPRPAPAPKAAAAPRQLQTRWLVAVAVLVLLGGAVMLYAVPLYSGHTMVVVVARDVKMRTILSAADLTTAEVAVGPQVAVVHPQDGVLLGKTALNDLSSGAILSPRQVGDAPVLASGQQLVPVRLKLGQRPQQGLSAGQQVLAVPAPADPSSPVAQALSKAQPVQATVVSAGDPDPATGDVVVDLRVPDSDALALTRNAATGALALTRNAATGALALTRNAATGALTLVLLPGAAQ